MSDDHGGFEVIIIPESAYSMKVLPDNWFFTLIYSYSYKRVPEGVKINKIIS